MISAPEASVVDIRDLHVVERRVLWLSARVVHWANNVRLETDPFKVGGHQASSASCASLMTALYFGRLGADDRVSVRPHASPVLYAIGFLLGRLEAEDLKTLRQFGGLQSYPSQNKQSMDRRFRSCSTAAAGQYCVVGLTTCPMRSTRYSSPQARARRCHNHRDPARRRLRTNAAAFPTARRPHLCRCRWDWGLRESSADQMRARTSLAVDESWQPGRCKPTREGEP